MRYQFKLGFFYTLIFVSSFAHGHAEEANTLSAKDYSLIIGSFVALLTWIGGQVFIPLYKYHHDQKKGKELIITVMKVVTDKSLDFFGDNISTSVFEKVLFLIDEQINKAKEDKNYFAHLSVSEGESVRNKVLNGEHFWLIDDELIQAFLKFEENAFRAGFMCEAVMDKNYHELVKDDRKRYISALEQVKKQFNTWLNSTRELKTILNNY